MRIKNLFLEIALLLITISLTVVLINTYQVHRTAQRDIQYLQKQYLNATYEIYKNSLIGDILVGNKTIESALLKEISNTRKVGSTLRIQGEQFKVGKHIPGSPTQTYTLNLGNEQHAILTLYPLQHLKVFDLFHELFIPLLIELCVLIIGFIYVLRKIKKKLLNPLNEISQNLDPKQIKHYQPQPGIVLELEKLITKLKKATHDAIKKAHFEAESIAAKQVAHDIRSPLACLNLLLTNTKGLPEKQRNLMRSSVQRITDIVNTLQRKAIEKESTGLHHSAVIMLPSIVEPLISEKRTQLGVSTSIAIDLHLEHSYGLFVKINQAEFKRALSNLINNAIEACTNGEHRIVINIKPTDNHMIELTIQDDGCGIPKHIIDNIYQSGFSYGKNQLDSAGSGLGLYHASNTIQSFNGELKIESIEKKGTTATILLPEAPVPSWFLNNLNLSQIKNLVILDDDLSIHMLWQERLEKLDSEAVTTYYFASPTSFRHRIRELPDFGQTLFLIDYEFANEQTNGLAIIEDLRLQEQAILVTSHDENEEILQKALSMGIKLIPKSIVAYVPINVEKLN